MAPVAGVRTEGKLSVPGTVVVVNGKLSFLFIVLKRCTSILTLIATLISCSSMAKSDRCEDNNWNECQAASSCRWSSGNGCVDNVSSLHLFCFL